MVIGGETDLAEHSRLRGDSERLASGGARECDDGRCRVAFPCATLASC